jgi:hypothetical protein
LTKENDKVEDDFILKLLENNDADERKVRDTKETKTELTIPNSKIRKELFPPTKEKFSKSDSPEKLMEDYRADVQSAVPGTSGLNKPSVKKRTTGKMMKIISGNLLNRYLHVEMHFKQMGEDCFSLILICVFNKQTCGIYIILL